MTFLFIYLSIIKIFFLARKNFSVGSFVWSHLHNLLKSSALNKVEIQSLLTDKNLSEKFNMDRRKFSRNYEYSIFLDEYNVGKI